MMTLYNEINANHLSFCTADPDQFIQDQERSVDLVISVESFLLLDWFLKTSQCFLIRLLVTKERHLLNTLVVG